MLHTPPSFFPIWSMLDYRIYFFIIITIFLIPLTFIIDWSYFPAFIKYYFAEAFFLFPSSSRSLSLSVKIFLFRVRSYFHSMWMIIVVIFMHMNFSTDLRCENEQKLFYFSFHLIFLLLNSHRCVINTLIVMSTMMFAPFHFMWRFKK